MKTSAYTPFDVSARDRIVGFFVIGAVLLFLVGFLIPFIQSLSDDKRIPFYTVLDQTYGIAPEAIVSLRGVPIGGVTAVGITRDGMVRVDIALSRIYEEFYTKRSTLTVDSNIGVSTILTGSGLILSPGKAENGLLEQGEFISTNAPQGIGSILEELDIAQLTDQVTDIVANVEEITAGLADNQDKIFMSIDNLAQVTAILAQVSGELPGMVNSVDQSLIALQSSMQGIDKLVLTADKDLQLTLKNAVQMTEQATLTLSEAEILFRATTPLMSQLPVVLVTTDIALQSITALTEQLSQSWLLGGGGEEVVKPALPATHPHDNQLYQQAPAAKNNIRSIP
ncbi:MAG: hypothetical protein CMQ19_03530 [Gammaproteobacteria bacterium]|nr:hypothetical protein [Gammaproteobacteria bacterium]